MNWLARIVTKVLNDLQPLFKKKKVLNDLPILENNE